MAISNNRRVAKNTLFLYVRMLLVMGVTLFTSRIILSALGIEDYGIYNVVGGLSSAMIFFSSTLTVSTQRFLNFEVGRGNIERLQRIFNTCLLIFIIIAIIVFIVGVIGGKWLVLNKLVIPDAQRYDAVMVLYATLISICATFVFSVYESVLVANENMKIYAFIGIFDAFAKLGISYLIYLVNEKLVMYAWMLCAVQLIPKLCLLIYCKKKYPEVEHKLYWDKSLSKELMGFTGWNLYGSTVWMINTQGLNVLLNIMFGPIVNAANGIATQVNHATNNFSTNFFTAVRPQLIKRYASGEHNSLINLIYSSSRFAFYLLWVLAFPIILRCEYILSVWLEEIPQYTSTFVQCTLIYYFINSFYNPLWTAISSTGDLKRSILIGSNLFLLAFPLSYVCFKLNAPPYVIFPVLSIGRLAFLVVIIQQLSNYINISFKSYSYHVFYPIAKVVIISAICSTVINYYLPQTFWGLLELCLISLAVNVTAIFILGISNSERQICLDSISQLKSRLFGRS